MFVDEADVLFKGGHGGAGRVSFYKRRRGPDGGNGGKGGSIYIKATSNLAALNRFSAEKVIEAQKGEAGGSNKKYGKDGSDLEILLPLGTTVLDKNTGEVWEISSDQERILIAKGGLGGRGNFEFRSSKNTTPEYAQPGLSGQERSLYLTLKFLADFGLIGPPNSGKSSLINELTASKSKVASYPFTTLEAVLGVLPHHPESSEGSKIIADIPGLIEGAGEGKGLGFKFLKHIEKVTVLLHCISSESENPLKDYEVIREELKKYNSELLKKQEIILLTKSDLLENSELERKVKQVRKQKKKVIPVSIYNFESIEKLKSLLAQSTKG